MTQFNRAGVPLRRTILATDLHPRLVNGSDYPLPAIDPLIRTGLLVDRGFLAAEERGPINELYEQNPLLFDFVLKRTVRVGEARYGREVFETRRVFGRSG